MKNCVKRNTHDGLKNDGLTLTGKQCTLLSKPVLQSYRNVVHFFVSSTLRRTNVCDTNEIPSLQRTDILSPFHWYCILHLNSFIKTLFVSSCYRFSVPPQTVYGARST